MQARNPDTPSHIWCATVTLAVMFAPPILEWLVNIFVDFITK